MSNDFQDDDEFQEIDPSLAVQFEKLMPAPTYEVAAEPTSI